MPEKVAVAIFPEELDNYINRNEKLGEGEEKHVLIGSTFIFFLVIIVLEQVFWK